MTSIIDLAKYDGLGLAELVRTKEVTAAELLEAVLARADTTNPIINAIVTRFDDAARAAINAGLPSGPFTGVPYLLKDLGAYYTGALTSFGSTFFTESADHDSEITARYKRAGLVIFGKTSTCELGLSVTRQPGNAAALAQAGDQARWQAQRERPPDMLQLAQVICANR